MGNNDSSVETFLQWIKASDNIVFFGGAGVSTESGIHDFRVLFTGAYAEERISRENERTNIKGSAFDMRNPVLIDLDELVKMTSLPNAYCLLVLLRKPSQS